MLRSFKILTFLTLILSCLLAYSQEQEPDTSIILRSYSVEENTLNVVSKDYDTTVQAIHEYNPIYHQSFSNTFLGNTGQAAITNNLARRETDNSFIFSVPYKFYIYNPYNIYHFNTRKPYTELKYLTSGSREDSEQVLSALHTQNINEFSNVGIFYDMIASRGIYNEQNTGLNRINLFGSYEKNNYSMFSSVHYNGFKFEENGGLLNLENFMNRESEALNYTMNLNDANSRFRNLDAFLTHELKFPALLSDSAQKEKFKGFSLQHTINYKRSIKNYEDEISTNDTLNFYQNNYYLIDQAKDSAFYSNLSNRLDLSIEFAKTQQLKAYLKHEYKTFSFINPSEVSYQTDSSIIDTVIRTYPKDKFNDISVGGIYKGTLKNWEYKATGELFFTGYRAGDLNAGGEFIRYFNQKAFHITLGGSFTRSRPSYFLQNYGSSHFIWKNDFKTTTRTNAFFDLGNERNLRARITLNFFTAYVFFNEEAIPEQNTGEIFTASLNLYKKFTWGPVNHIHQILLQKGADEIINIPLLAYNNSTWYQNELFNKVLKFRLGFDFYYYTSYFADSFMPATGMFYSQYNSKIGNYPFLDVFADIKLKRTRFTVQYTNALSELMPEANYFMAFRNPNFGATFKFGIAWTFYD